jgi:predicted DsbA family dithiol-disulfide isomerase
LLNDLYRKFNEVHIPVKNLPATIVLSCLALLLPYLAWAQSRAEATATTTATSQQKNIESYLRNLYALGPDVKVAVGPFKESGVEGLRETNVEVTLEGNKQSVKFYSSNNGKYLMQGELMDLTEDPLAKNRGQIQIQGAPVLGPANAPVILVEYSDFECPVCRSLHDVLRAVLPNYKGQIRVVFKDFPLEELHPWARTAALSGHCAYEQNPDAFWKMYDLIYDNQEVISASNAYMKMMEFAERTGLQAEPFKACLASPEAAAAVEANRANGQTLQVNATPTVFVNGRRMVGADQHLLEQYIKFEVGKSNSAH